MCAVSFLQMSVIIQILNIKMSIVQVIWFPSETDKSQFSHLILKSQAVQWVLNLFKQAKILCSDSWQTLEFFTTKPKFSNPVIPSNFTRLRPLKWKWIFPVVFAVVSHFIFQAFCPASLCPIVAATFWKMFVSDDLNCIAFHFRDQYAPFHNPIGTV